MSACEQYCSGRRLSRTACNRDMSDIAMPAQVFSSQQTMQSASRGSVRETTVQPLCRFDPVLVLFPEPYDVLEVDARVAGSISFPAPSSGSQSQGRRGWGSTIGNIFTRVAVIVGTTMLRLRRRSLLWRHVFRP
jgi:hypothetical protein